MGFDFIQGASKHDIIAEQTKTTSYSKTLIFKVKQNVLWAIKEYTSASGESNKWIYCGVMKSYKGFGWGFHAMDESVGPFNYSCPLEFLDLAPETCPQWRAEVRKHASNKVLPVNLE